MHACRDSARMSVGEQVHMSHAAPDSDGERPDRSIVVATDRFRVCLIGREKERRRAERCRTRLGRAFESLPLRHRDRRRNDREERGHQREDDPHAAALTP